MAYGPDTIYIIGIAKSQQHNPITQQFGRFLLGFVVNRKTGEILSCGSTVVMKSTYDFLDELFQGRNIETDARRSAAKSRTDTSARRRKRSWLRTAMRSGVSACTAKACVAIP